MRKFKTVASNVLIAVLAAVVVLVVVSKLCFGVEMKAVLTGSMEPDIPVGSLVVVEPTPYEGILVGDDVTFVRDENLTLVTHRVVSKDDATQYITTQGVANNTPDAPTSYANVVGKVAFHIPYVGYLVVWTSTLKGKVVLVTIVVALVALSVLFSSSEDEPTELEADTVQTLSKRRKHHES